MNFKRMAIISAVALLAGVIIMFPLVSLFSKNVNNKYFVGIDEFDHLQNYVIDDDDLSNDNYLEDGAIVDSFTEKIKYNGKTYTVYAYVFTDCETSITYFNRYTGKKSNADWNFTMSTNYYFSSKYIAYYQDCLYRIEGGNYDDFVDAVNFITDSFSVTYSDLRQ